jgi:hypothetical protein
VPLHVFSQKKSIAPKGVHLGVQVSNVRWQIGESVDVLKIPARELFYLDMPEAVVSTCR